MTIAPHVFDITIQTRDTDLRLPRGTAGAFRRLVVPAEDLFRAISISNADSLGRIVSIEEYCPAAASFRDCTDDQLDDLLTSPSNERRFNKDAWEKNYGQRHLRDIEGLAANILPKLAHALSYSVIPGLEVHAQPWSVVTVGIRNPDDSFSDTSTRIPVSPFQRAAVVSIDDLVIPDRERGWPALLGIARRMIRLVDEFSLN